MREWDRVDGLTVPMPLPGQKLGEAVPKTYVKIKLEITGGGLPEGEEVVWQSEQLELTDPGQLMIDVREEPTEDWDWDIAFMQNPERRVWMALEGAPSVSEEGTIYTMTVEGQELRG